MKILPPKGLPEALKPYWTPESRAYTDDLDLWYLYPAKVHKWNHETEVRSGTTANESDVKACTNYRLVPNPTQGAPMPEKITMTFHPIESKPETVKPRRLSEFKPGEKVVFGNTQRTVVYSHHYSRNTLLSHDFRVDDSWAEENVWYLESDWINGRPREIPAEVTRKRLDEMKVGDVFDAGGDRMYIACKTTSCTWAVYLDAIRCPQQFSFGHDVKHTLLGHVTFESCQ